MLKIGHISDCCISSSTRRGKRRETFACATAGLLGPDATNSVVSRAATAGIVERVCAGFNCAVVTVAADPRAARGYFFGYVRKKKKKKKKQNLLVDQGTRGVDQSYYIPYFPLILSICSLSITPPGDSTAGGSAGVIAQATGALFDELAAKRQRLSEKKKTRDGSFSYTVGVSGIAHRAEDFADLLDEDAAAAGTAPRFEDLPVETDLEEGPVVTGVTVAEGSDRADLLGVVAGLCRARLALPDAADADTGASSSAAVATTTATTTATAATSTATVGNIATMVTISVSQALESADGSSPTRVLQAWLRFIELPDAGALAIPPGRLSVMDGPLAHRGAIAFDTMVRSLAELQGLQGLQRQEEEEEDAQEDRGGGSGGGGGAAGHGGARRAVRGGRTAIYNDSKFTRLLRDPFGGNCITRVVAFASPEDRTRTVAALRYAALCATIANHAVLNDGPTLGLLATHRAESNALHAALHVTRGGDPGGIGGDGCSAADHWLI
jgi:hypothetical protein